MMPTEPLPLNHSWPTFEAAERMAIPGLDGFPADALHSPQLLAAMNDLLALRGIGLWQCDLANERLTWSSSVYDLFGLPQDEPVTRSLAVSLYRPDSRRAMESLRAHAIRFRRGFTVDAEIRQPGGDDRWMRLLALPVVEDDKVVRLCGLKIDVTWHYDAA
jgi:PAS domain-containing protein